MPSSSLIRAAGGEFWPTLHLVVAGFAALLLASPGRAAVFWLITTGAVDSGMPAWWSLPDQER
jgi:hypothetical protein